MLPLGLAAQLEMRYFQRPYRLCFLHGSPDVENAVPFRNEGIVAELVADPPPKLGWKIKKFVVITHSQLRNQDRAVSQPFKGIKGFDTELDPNLFQAIPPAATGDSAGTDCRIQKRPKSIGVISLHRKDSHHDSCPLLC
jgi:hypothetical protein